MSKSKLRRTAEPAARPQAPAPPANRRARWIAIGALLLVLLVGALVWADWHYGLPEGAEAHYVGRQSCIDCHQPQHKSWTGSHHDLAMDLATEKTVLGDFNNAELTHYGVTSRMFRRDGKFLVNTEGPDGKLADFEVKYVLGVTPLQQYMVEFDRPTDMPENEVPRVQVLRVSWDTKAKKWFHLDPPDVKEKLDPADDLHWTGVAQRWNNMCADCHTTNLRKNFDDASGTYHTTFSEIDVSCETCHGPGSLHVQLAKSPSLFWDRERGYALANLKDPKSNVPQVQACAPCHSRRQIVQAGSYGGCNYYDYFENTLLNSGTYHADGQILDEVYEYSSFLQSKMYHKGVRCTDCHDPHSLQLKFEGNKVCTSCHQHPSAKYDSLAHHRHPIGSKGAECVNCHMPQTTYMDVDPRRDHSFRVPRPDLSVKIGTPNSCTSCHIRDERLPGLASGRREPPGNSGTEKASLPEQTFDLPALLARPDLKEYADWLRLAREGDAEVRERLAEVNRWADETLTTWYGAARKREPHFAEALHAAREMTPDAPNQLLELLKNRSFPAVARATAAQELAAYVEPGTEIQRELIEALSDRDPQVRAAAVRTLQQVPSESLIEVLVPLLKDPTRGVRNEVANALSLVQDPRFNAEERAAMKDAVLGLVETLEINNDRAGGHLMVGILQEQLVQQIIPVREQRPEHFEKAILAYETAIRIESQTTGPRSNLALLYEHLVDAAEDRAQALAQSGQRDAAIAELQSVFPLQADAARLNTEELGLLERDVRFVPANAGLQGTVGLARYRQGWHKEAEHGLLAAHLLEPRNPLHAFRLAIFYKDTGRPERALELARSLIKLRPDNEQFQQLEREILQSRPAGPEP